MQVRLAAIGDLHLRVQAAEPLAAKLAALNGRADALVVAGDITDGGRIAEAEVAAELFSTVRMPIVAVMGNHDRRCLRRLRFRETLERAGVILLDAESTALSLTPHGVAVGFAGIGGYGGGFWPDEGPLLPHHRVSQALAVRARREATRLDAALAGLATNLTVVVMHYSPTASTLGAEPPLKYWMLGNSELARVIDRHDVDLVVHGHAHLGNPCGRTPGGTPVRNVAAAVTGGPTLIELAWPRRPQPAPALRRAPELVEICR